MQDRSSCCRAGHNRVRGRRIWSRCARIAPPDPPGLIGREAELAELARFCLDPDGGPYAWWQAGPWAGKSALLSTFVLRPPPEVAEQVRIVSFFITARLAAQDTREAFTQVLAGAAGRPAGPVPAGGAAGGDPGGLPAGPDVRRPRSRARDAGGRLVLVVDGLDEDRGVTTGPDAHSIAGLLPADPPAGMRVIVAGRPNPPVPDDVPDWHPLRDPAIIRPLPDFPARAGRAAAGQARAAAPAARQPGGAGRARAADRRPRRPVRPGPGRAGRRPAVGGRGHPAHGGRADAPEPPQPRSTPRARPEVYLLGHEELQAAADRTTSATASPAYHERLHAWAAGYRARGWPAETPEYLLGGYFRLLDDLGDLPRMTECALDTARHDRMLDLTGGDAAALAEARTALDRIAAQDDPDLASALALACHRDHLADRNAHIPDSLPAVWAALGQLSRAQALAPSLTARARRRAPWPRSRERWPGPGSTSRPRPSPRRPWPSPAPPSPAGRPAPWPSRGRGAGRGRAAPARRGPRYAGRGHRPLHHRAGLAGERPGRGRAGAGPGRAAPAGRDRRPLHHRPRLAGERPGRRRGQLAEAGQHQHATPPSPHRHEPSTRSITEPDWRASALARVAGALAQAGQHQHAE